MIKKYFSLTLYLIFTFFAANTHAQGYNVTHPAMSGFEDVTLDGLTVLYIWYYFIYVLFFGWLLYCIYVKFISKEWLEFHHKVAGPIIIAMGLVTKLIIWLFESY